jgi:hypothetical protein
MGVFCGYSPDFPFIESLRCDFGRMSLISTFKQILEAKKSKALSSRHPAALLTKTESIFAYHDVFRSEKYKNREYFRVW